MLDYTQRTMPENPTRGSSLTNEEPKAEDKQRFLKYFWNYNEQTESLATMPAHLPGRLSANDLCVVRLSQHLLDSTRDCRPSLLPRVYWLYFKPWDIDRIRQFRRTQIPGRLLVHQGMPPGAAGLHVNR